MFLDRTPWRKNLFATLLATTMLCTGCLKKGLVDQQPTMAAIDWELNIRQEVVAAFNTDAPIVPMAQVIDAALIDTTRYLKMQPYDTTRMLWEETDPLNRCIDVDSLLTVAERTNKSHIYFDTRTESYHALSKNPDTTAHYAAFAVDDLKAVNDKMKKDSRRLDVPEGKMFLWFFDQSNLFNASAQPTHLGALHPGKTAVVITTKAMRQYDVPSLKDGEAHELGHAIAEKRFNQTVFSLAYMSAADTSKKHEAVLRLLEARRYSEYQCDSVALTLSEDRDNAHRYLTVREQQRRHDNKAMMDTVNARNIDATLYAVLENTMTSAAERAHADDPFSTHPSSANRIRHMKLVQAYTETKNDMDKSILQGLMIKPQAVGWMPFNWYLVANQPK